ncbi:MAG: Lipolytic protein G-D-S-L family [Candidatus Uhrbacteria bacterium GW2011_GWF2_39_13]|uniref:Lipolytic protein G-D-S-L family n=1 Tax=Candidatus Uhrbacteria bacterium GW2011_GWF2_39_13 TaxID=1618995 RepID=A0A0G0ML18_9BACT|nr:MAG: Lipolytic protein G-D-S-L family [Candidatus Uhrbacteria bacterium GW2011_GWF2_39_13]
MKSLFVIGDSISCYYGRYLEKMLSGIMEYDRKGGSHTLTDLDDCTNGINGGDSSMVLTYLKEVVKKEWFNPDILLLNCGLHDIKTHPETGALQVPLKQYRKNLDNILSITSDRKITVVWVRTTPLNQKHYTDSKLFVRRAENISEYNSVADQIMKSNNIPVIDLFAFTKTLGDDIYLNGTDDVHFNEKAAAEQAAFIAGWIYCRVTRIDCINKGMYS